MHGQEIEEINPVLQLLMRIGSAIEDKRDNTL
jgi:hypothetical protein